MIWNVAWRNVWRNPTRSLIIIMAIIIGIFAGTFSTALFNGMMEQRVQNAIKSELSHIQIHEKNFFKMKEKQYFIPHATEVEKVIKNTPNIKAYSDRVIINAMISSAETGSGVRLMGVNPARESVVTDLSNKVVKGTYFKNNKKNRIVIGKKLAEKLKVKVKSKVVVTLQTMQDTIVYTAFKVAGIYETVNSTYDKTNAFVNINDLQRIIKMNTGSCHEIAILLNNNMATDSVKQSLVKQLPDYDIKSWKDLSPEMIMLTSSMKTITTIFIVIILVALLFSIINTMMMVVIERTKEIGMLMSIGMVRKKVFSMILLETLYLSGFAGVIGTAIGYGIAKIFSHIGIDLSSLYGQGLKSYGFDPTVYPDINIVSAINIALLVLFTGFIAALSPARKAIRLNPAEAVRTDM